MNTDSEDFAERVITLLNRSLIEEEKALGIRTEAIRSVYQYNEDWIRFLLFKELARAMRTVGIWIEEGRVDIAVGQITHIEIKGPLRVPVPTQAMDRAIYRKVLMDFSKQRSRRGENLRIHHYVLLLLHGSAQVEIENWLEALRTDLNDANPGLQLDERRSQHVRLNIDDRVLQCVLFEITA